MYIYIFFSRCFFSTFLHNTLQDLLNWSLIGPFLLKEAGFGAGGMAALFFFFFEKLGMPGMSGMPGMPGMSPVGPGGPKVVQKRSRGWKCQKRWSDLKSVQRSKQGEKERFYLIVDFSANFWARETCSTSKESSEHQQFRFEIKAGVLFIKSLKEINVFEIFDGGQNFKRS